MSRGGGGGGVYCLAKWLFNFAKKQCSGVHIAYDITAEARKEKNGKKRKEKEEDCR